MHFDTKSYLKSNRNNTTKQTPINLETRLFQDFFKVKTFFKNKIN